MISKTLNFLNKAEEYLLGLMVLQMGLSIFLQVIMRYIFHSAITWLDELVHLEVILLTFFGAGLGIKHGAHISIDLLKSWVTGPYANLLGAVNHLIIAVYTGILIYVGANLIAMMTAHPHFTPTLRIPKHYMYFMVLIGLALIGVRCLIKTGQYLYELASGRSSGTSA